MILQRMPIGMHACLLYSTAMLLGEPAEQLIRELGVNPQQVIWPHLDAPMRFRGVHIEEIQDLLFARKRVLATIAVMPVLAPTTTVEPVAAYTDEMANRRLFHYLRDHDTIIEGQLAGGVRHAVACDGLRIYDPRGRERTLPDFGMGVERIHVLCKPM